MKTSAAWLKRWQHYFHLALLKADSRRTLPVGKYLHIKARIKKNAKCMCCLVQGCSFPAELQQPLHHGVYRQQQQHEMWLWL